MKSLALYIDKWYIVGAVNTDGITRLVNLPNHEDRIWLYFYEDVANDEISYGKGFQSKFRNNENHYYGDVFSLLTQSSAKYTMFKRSQPMRGIFKSSKIFDDLRKDIGEDGDINTFVSFSKDISLASRLLFLEELKKERFDVKESVARIGHLALEYASKKSGYIEDGYYLVLNACNENLHYSLYQKTDDLFNREKEDVLIGMGTDVRSRALIEHVVDNINDREHFLKTVEERESEYLRMNQYVDDWLVRLSTAKGFIPIQLTNVTFSRDPYKDYSVSVRKVKIDERTEKIVKDIINVIVHFVKDAEISHEQLRGILFLGNTFTNVQFKKELASYYNLDNSKMVGFKDSDLSSLVSAYTFIDCEQFSATKNVMRGNAEAELRRIKIAEEEAAALKRAQEEAEAVAAGEREATEAERKYKDAMDRGYDAEREHNYDDMEEYFHIALGLRPDDEEAKQKHEEALRKKAEMAVQQNHYKEKIQQAKSAYDEGDYETAKFKAEEALSFMPESKEAKRIKDDSTRRIKSLKDLERFLDRADLFIAQKAYKEAIQELQKARLLDVDDKEIVERETRIAREQNAVKELVEQLTQSLNSALSHGQFDEALKYCNELIDIDFVNSRRWGVLIAEIKSKKEKYAEEQKRWENLIRDIDSSLLAEEWQKLSELCKEALSLREDSDIRTKLDKAEKKLLEIRQNELFAKTMSEINELAVRKEFDEANTRLNNLERSLRREGLLDSEKEKQIKDTRRRLFDFTGAMAQEPTRTDVHKRITGFTSEPKQKASQKHKKPVEDSDFDWDFNPSTPPKQSDRHQQQKPKSNDDFFDSASDIRPNPKSSTPKTRGEITNDDFNF
ncbi:MAG: hypothetical protein J6I36_07325 [Bacteroidaceae bacterium]|nr:hypothetical protein [Bacteroidaceae bacterium]